MQVEPDQLDGLRHALAVDAGDALRQVDVVEGRRRASLRDAVPVHVPVAHGHQRARVACRGGCVQVEHRHGLPALQVGPDRVRRRVQDAQIELRVRVAHLGGALEERGRLREVALHAGADQVQLPEGRRARRPRGGLRRLLDALPQARQGLRVLPAPVGRLGLAQVLSAGEVRPGVAAGAPARRGHGAPLPVLGGGCLQRHRELQERDLHAPEHHQQAHGGHQEP
mmetsp:Transcript_16203/g.48136  ORF Transcript_16203/g.48136 Transcript_16203/m.48136 type:complete len:225 (+) Transcript_16203:1537-2211(+)